MSHYQRRHRCWQSRHQENPSHLRPEQWGFSCTELLTPCRQLMAHFQNLLAFLALKRDCTNHKNVQTTYCQSIGYILYWSAQWGIKWINKFLEFIYLKMTRNNSICVLPQRLFFSGAGLGNLLNFYWRRLNLIILEPPQTKTSQAWKSSINE